MGCEQCSEICGINQVGPVDAQPQGVINQIRGAIGLGRGRLQPLPDVMVDPRLHLIQRANMLNIRNNVS